MDQIRTEIRTYTLVRELPCVLCGSVFEQRYAAVVLFEGDRQLGELCPRCFAEGPTAAAARLQQYATTLWARAELLRQQAGEATAQSESLLRRAAERLSFVRERFGLADRLKKTKRWSNDLAELEAAEATALQPRLPDLPPEDLRRQVAERYRQLLAESDGPASSSP